MIIVLCYFKAKLTSWVRVMVCINPQVIVDQSVHCLHWAGEELQFVLSPGRAWLRGSTAWVWSQTPVNIKVSNVEKC